MDVTIRAERDRLLSDANVARLRRDFAAMEKACRDVIALTGEDGEIVELLGDALYGQGKGAEARDCYQKSAELASGRASAEVKYARLVLELAEAEREIQANLTELEHPGAHTRPSHHAAGSSILSILFPGLGQLVNGEYIKGGILLGVFVLCLTLIAVLPDSRQLARQLSGSSSGAGQGIPWTPLLFATIAIFCYVYSIIDAVTEAAKSSASGSQAKSGSGAGKAGSEGKGSPPS